MKKLVMFLFVLMFAGSVFALTTADVDENSAVEYEDGYFIGVFFKEFTTGNVFKVVNTDDETIWLAPFESGQIVSQDQVEEYEVGEEGGDE